MDRMAAAAYAWSHTAAPMLSGTLVTIAGFLPVGFANSTAGEYAGNIFWFVGFALIVSWVVAVSFTPYLGVKMLPDIKPVEGGHQAIYGTPNYRRLRRLITFAVRHKIVTCVIVAIASRFRDDLFRLVLSLRHSWHPPKARKPTSGRTTFQGADQFRSPVAGHRLPHWG